MEALKAACSALYREFVLQQEERSQFHDRFVTLPNLITGAGLLFCVLYVIQYTIGYAEYLIPVTIICIGLSDFFDGMLARHCKQHSWFGKFFDLFRDKCTRLAVMGNLVAVLGTPVLMPLFVLAVMEVFTLRWEWRYYRTRTVVHGHPLVRICQPLALLLVFLITIDLYWITLGLPLLILAWLFALARVATLPFNLRAAQTAL